MKKIIWFLQRISVMNKQEVLHQLKEQARLAVWKIQYKFGYSKFIEGKEKEFSFCNETTYLLPEFSWQVVDQEAVQEIIENRQRLYQSPVIFNRSTNNCWRTAPETNKLWPHIFFASIDYREGNPTGDVRIAWEASRLQYFVTIALYIKQNPETELKATLLDIIHNDIRSWYEQNPLMQGIHYISSLECALRIIALTVTCDLLRTEIARDSETWKTLTNIVLEHAYFTRRRLSLFSATGNHTLGEAAGLIYAGVLFTEHHSAHDWLDTGITVFTRELDNQIDQRGVGVEQAPDYTVQILEYALLVKKLLSHKDTEISRTFENALQRGLEDIKATYAILGVIPALGDSDSASALSPYFNELRGMLVKKDDKDIYNNGSLTALKGKRAMANYAILVDHGPLGMQPKCSHAHADALSVTMYRNGRAILVDSGTYSYTGAPELRDYFRSTKAHNTVSVGHLDQATKKMLFMWSNPYSCDLLESSAEHDKHTVVAKHDGFAALGVEHVRRVILHHDYGLFVVDDLLGHNLTSEHCFEIYWHIGGCVEAIEGAGYRLIEDNLDITFTATVESRLVSASEDHTYGWASESYFSRKPINSLILSGRSTLPVSVVTSFIKDAAYKKKEGQQWLRDVQRLASTQADIRQAKL